MTTRPAVHINFSVFCPHVSCHQKEKRDGRRGEEATNSTLCGQPPNNRKQAAHVKKCQNRGRREEAHRDPCHAIRPYYCSFIVVNIHLFIYSCRKRPRSSLVLLFYTSLSYFHYQPTSQAISKQIHRRILLEISSHHLSNTITSHELINRCNE